MGTSDVLNHTAKVLSADRVYADAETVDGITVIPAASVRGGGGGGDGKSGDGGDMGEGSGFGVSATPVGALVIDGQRVRWKVPFNLNRAILGGQMVGVAFFLFAWLTERSKARAAVKIARINARATSN
jgi:uncharacterized spore protein YtfJ